MQIGQKISELRKARNLTQENLASAIGVSSQAVSKWESGGTPDVELLLKIADYFNVSLDALFGRAVSDYAGIEAELLKAIAEAPQEKRFAKAFEYCWVIENGIMGATELETTADDVLERCKISQDVKWFSEVLWDDGITKMSLNKGLKYFLIMPEPSCGWKQVFGYKDQYAELFTLLGDRNTLRALHFFYERENKPFTPRLLEKVLGVDIIEADKILDKLAHFKFITTSIIELDDEEKTVYNLDPNPAYIGLLAMCEDLLEKPSAFAGSYHARRKPYLYSSPE